MYWCVQGFLYLAGVSCAGLRNVAVVHGIATRHASQLVLSKKTTTTEEDGKQREANKAEGQRVNRGLHKQRQTIQFKCWNVLKQLTLQSLQQSPLLHMALWVRVHFLQQLAPLRAHSYGFIVHVKIMCVRVTFWSHITGYNPTQIQSRVPVDSPPWYNEG